MSIGKLYRSNDGEFEFEIDYQFQNESATNWWGELMFVEYARISDGSGYIIELEDKRKGSCHIKKRVNRAVTGVPPRYVYHFAGTGPLE